MKKFLTNNSKKIYLAYGILLFVVILFGLYFMTDYCHINVAFNVSDAGITFQPENVNDVNVTNKYLFEYFTKYAGAVPGWLESNKAFADTQAQFLAAFPDAANFSEVYAPIIYQFQTSMSAYNDMIIYFGLFGIVMFAGLLLLSNHNRRIYYKSNLIGGIVLPIFVIGFAIYMIILDIGLLAYFEENIELFNITSLLKNPNGYETISQQAYPVLMEKFSLNNAVFFVCIALLVIVIAYSVFLCFYANYKYKETAAEREEILRKAGK